MIEAIAGLCVFLGISLFLAYAFKIYRR
jgi:hypothetical protein